MMFSPVWHSGMDEKISFLYSPVPLNARVFQQQLDTSAGFQPTVKMQRRR